MTVRFRMPQLDGLRLPTFITGAAWIYGGQMVRGGFTLIVAAVGARLLSVQDYGLFSFTISFFSWVALLVEGGVATSSARLISLTERREWDGLMSAFATIFMLLAGSAAIAITLGAGPLARLFGLPVETILRVCAVPGIGIMWLTSLRILLPAVDRPRLIAYLEAAPWIITTAALCTVGLWLRSALAFSFFFTLANLVSGLWVVFSIARIRRPEGAEIRKTLHQMRIFGFAMYGARLVSTGGFIMDVPLLALFLHDTRLVAYYSMSKSLAAPLAIVGQSISTALFRKFAASDRVDRKVMILVLASTLALAAAYVVASPLVVAVVLPKTYAPIVPYLLIWVATMTFQSLYQPPMMFLQAHGRGRSLALLSFLFGLTAVVGYATLIPRLQVTGACLAALMAVLVWTAGSWLIYLRYRGAIRA